ncbi:DUF397 domain-containing protein [Spirillospora sp. NBC_01491]|uniref:DUF397 domain-containing protein n=1 Tax=Spirillospora sp. NBC_01491 TaxID=2976007 RepID=UPI002E30EBED|nr:DUF397 domain-containing protein [Spirillospora sp. NBC_01491]
MVYQSIRGPELNWRKSSVSAPGDECVEVAALGPSVLIRDSHDHSAGTLVLDPAQWRAFVGGIRDGARGDG